MKKLLANSNQPDIMLVKLFKDVIESSHEKEKVE